MNTHRNFFLAITTFFLISCTNDSESDLINYSSIKNITYTKTIKPIITEHCISCHSQPPQNGAPMSLLTYDNLKDAVVNRGLIDRISSFDSGFSMPFGGPRLPQSKIDQIKAWRNAEFPE